MLDARSIAMDTDSTTIEVHGVPSIFPEDRMIDKLTMHFLRPRNGGGEVLRVLYSSRTPRQAFVIFERSDVAACVLQKNQILEFDGQSFPLKVSRGQLAEVDLPVRTTLDLWRFQNEEAVLSILSRYGFKMSRQSSQQLLLEGTFLKLSAARVKLGELLSSEGQSHRPGIHSSGVVSKRRGSSDADAPYRLNGAAVHAGSWSLDKAEPSPSHSSTPSRRPYDTQSGGSTASTTTSLPSDSLLGRRLSPSPLPDRASFGVDANALHYARSFHGDRVEEILQAHHVAMVVEDGGCAGVSTVVLRGHQAPLAEIKLTRFLTEVQSDLRTQEIPLSSMSPGQLSQVAKRAQMLSGCYKVLVLQVGDSLHLVGSSSESYEMKRKILADEASRPSSGREEATQERGRSPRRSSSLPRQPSRERVTDLEPSSGAAAGHSGYSSAKYDERPAGRRSRPEAPGAVSAPPAEPRRIRSSSESRVKVKEGRATPGQGDAGRLPPAGAQTAMVKVQPVKSKLFPFVKPSLSITSPKDYFRRKKSDLV